MKNLKIKPQRLGLLAVISLMCAVTACHDFFEKNIEDNVVLMVSPTDGGSSPIYLQKFIWKPVNGAREYHIQLVTPSFDKLSQIVMDTVVASTNLMVTLTPNKYQMSIYAQNAGYQSKVTTISFDITESYDLSPQEMNPTQPTNLSATNATAITFRWDTITGATSYSFELFDANGKTVGGAIPVTTNSITIPSSDTKIEQLTEQAYSWRIFARNEISDSKAIISRFTVDRTAPVQPKTLQPNESDTTKVATSLFSWTKNADTGTPIADSIIIASDQGFGTIVKRALCTNNSFSYTFPSSVATYFWKLKQSDAAGNTTETQPRKLLVLPQ
ncbi:hypothetical protein [uncultured Acetobacteroides sp.]|uniref:hypothetical protein n=1 Tax=uncultured Acetobacteroides sp. TaxID=1760811 RepID=UPI0029F495F5|nr:hypothetical protein [uncultured Acetobacteroides sp.]